MEAGNGAERLDGKAMEAFVKRSQDGPVYMLNLLEFLPDGGAERYAEYGVAVAPLLEDVGGRPIFAGRPGESLIGEGSWDLMVLVEYPSRQAFLDMISSAEYRRIGHLRTEALQRSELRALDAIDAGALPGGG